MSDVTSEAAETRGLTQAQRVINTFTAPSKTFEDIRRGNRSWWLPFIVLAVFGYLFFAVVSQRVGMEQVVANQIRMNPASQEKMAQATPQQRATGAKIALDVTEGAFVAGPVLGLIGALIISLVLWGTINFLFGGRAKYGQVFAVSYFAWLPNIVKLILGIITLYAGMAPESFNVKNYSPTNVGAFLDPASTSHALYSLATSVDIITIWTLVLLSIGLATVAGVKRKSGYIAVFGWWIIVVLCGVGFAAAFG